MTMTPLPWSDRDCLFFSSLGYAMDPGMFQEVGAPCPKGLGGGEALYALGE